MEKLFGAVECGECGLCGEFCLDTDAVECGECGVWRVLFGHRWNDDGDGELCLDTDGMIIVGASGASCLDTDGYHS